MCVHGCSLLCAIVLLMVSWLFCWLYIGGGGNSSSSSSSRYGCNCYSFCSIRTFSNIFNQVLGKDKITAAERNEDK